MAICGSARNRNLPPQGRPSCQDQLACTVVGSRTLVAAVADGAGSAALAERGAEVAVETVIQVLSHALDAGRSDYHAMLREAAVVAREAVLTEAQQYGSEPRDLASTLLVVVVGPSGGGALQIGDGVIAVSDDANGWCWVFWPQRGEYANTTHFLTGEDAVERLQIEPFVGKVTDVALMTDGLESLALHYASKSVHEPFFHVPATFRRRWGRGDQSSFGIAGALPLIRARWIADGRRRVAHSGNLPIARSSTMMQLTLTRARTSIRLGQELGRGGEGRFLRLRGRKIGSPRSMRRRPIIEKPRSSLSWRSGEPSAAEDCCLAR